MSDEFYIGYLAEAPPQTARAVRRTVGLLAGLLLAAGVALAFVLPSPRGGAFEFGTTREFRGTVGCLAGEHPWLAGKDRGYLLVGPGKHGAREWCGDGGGAGVVSGTLITRSTWSAIEVASVAKSGDAASGVFPTGPIENLGTHTLTGEIVDPKCFLGVMNPGEGRSHRACARQCLRGGITPVFVARDKTGAEVRLLVSLGGGDAAVEPLLHWVGEVVQGTGAVERLGGTLVWHLQPGTLRVAKQ